MSNRRVRLTGSPVTHVVFWSCDTGGHTRCSVGFVWPTYGQTPEAYLVEDDCDCMTCLVNKAGVSMVNSAAINKLKFSDEE